MAIFCITRQFFRRPTKLGRSKATMEISDLAIESMIDCRCCAHANRGALPTAA